MGEAVAHGSGQRAPVRCGRRGGDGLCGVPRRLAPVGRGQLDHAAEQPLFRAAAQQHGPVRAGQPERDAVAQRPLRLLGLHRQVLGNAEQRRRRNRRATGTARSAAARGVHSTAPRSIIACAKSPARCSRHQRGGEGAQPRLGARQRRRARRTAAPRPARHCRRPPRPADRRRSPRSPPRCSRRSRAARAAAAGSSGKRAAMRRDDGPRAGVQVAGAGVIAEPLPGMQHLVERGRGQRANIGKARHELVKIGADRRDRRLLQHDLAEPDAVGVGRLAGRGAPGQVAAVAVVPGEQRRGIGAARRQGRGRIGLAGMNGRDSGARRPGTDRPDAPAARASAGPGLRPVGVGCRRAIAAPIVARGGGGVLARLKAEWSAVAGAELAAQTWPEKLGRDGALKLRVAPGFALDLQHRAPLVIERINLFFGRAAVTRLVLVQGPLPLAGSAPAGPRSRRRPRLRPETMPAARFAARRDRRSGAARRAGRARRLACALRGRPASSGKPLQCPRRRGCAALAKRLTQLLYWEGCNAGNLVCPVVPDGACRGVSGRRRRRRRRRSATPPACCSRRRRTASSARPTRRSRSSNTPR